MIIRISSLGNEPRSDLLMELYTHVCLVKTSYLGPQCLLAAVMKLLLNQY